MRDLSLHLLDLFENSVRASATLIELYLELDSKTKNLRIAIEDDGVGLALSTDEATDPFFTSKPGKQVGLGLSLFRASVEATGGKMWLERSALGGAAIKAEMNLGHVDMLPLGDIATTISSLVLTNPEIDLRCHCTRDDVLSTVQVSDIRERLPADRASSFVVSRRVHDAIVQSLSTLWDNPTATLSLKEEQMADTEKCCCSCQEQVSEAELLKQLDELLEDYRDKPGSLIPVLQIAQGIFGYLPEHVLRHIASALHKPYSEVAGVVGFYSYFSTQPRGKHVIRICLGTACYVRGGKQVLTAMKNKLGIDVGQTTEDRLFTLEVARCFGACGLAPAIMIDETVHQRVKPARLSDILTQYSN